MRKVMLLLLFLLPTLIFAQEIKERRVYYLDCSQSMSGIGQGAIDIWDNVIANLIEAIKDSPTSDKCELVVVKFADNKLYENDNLEGYSQRATTIGKSKLINYVKSITKPNGDQGTKTYHKNPINDFINNRAKSAETTYMFLLTDGDDEDTINHVFDNKVSNWPYKTGQVYSFYIMLNESHQKTEAYKKRDSLIKQTPHFWSIKTANVNVSPIKPIAVDTLDIRSKEKKYVDILFNGKIKDIEFAVSVKDQLKVTKDAECINEDRLRVYLESSITDYDVFPESFVKHLSIKWPKADSEGVYINNNTYSILVENNIDIPCVCQPGNNISVTNKNLNNWSYDETIIPIKTTDLLLNPNKELGTIKYYTKSFFYPKDSIIKAVNTLSFTYNKKASEVGSYAKLKFVTKDSCLNNENFKIFIKGKELKDKTVLVKNPQSVECSFWMSSDVPTGEYTIFLELLDNDLMFFNDKNIPENKIVQTWTIKHKEILDPGWVWFWRILLILIALITLIVIGIASAFAARHARAPKFLQISGLSFIVTENHQNPLGNVVLQGNPPYGMLTNGGANSINVGFLSRKYIQEIVIYDENTNNWQNRDNYLKSKKISWFSKKWNGEIITISTDFLGRDIHAISIVPHKSERGTILKVKTLYNKVERTEIDLNLYLLINHHHTNDVVLNETNLILQGYNRMFGGVMPGIKNNRNIFQRTINKISQLIKNK